MASQEQSYSRDLEVGHAEQARTVLNAAPLVSVVIVTYRSSNELPACVESVMQQSVPLEVLLVDNASSDQTPKIINDYAARFDNIHAILNSQNLGLAAGNNCALGKSQGKYLLILNPDTVLPERTLQRMLTFMEDNPDIGVIGPQSLYQGGSSHVSFHRYWGMLSVLLWRIIPYRISRSIYDRFSSYKRQDVLFVSGACLFVRRAIFEQIGGYDPQYFLTVEDALDLCLRVKKTGYRVVFLPEVQVVHFTGRSGVQAPYLSVWQANRGTIYHFFKHRGTFQALLVSLLLIAAAGMRVIVASLLGTTQKRYRNVAQIYRKVLWDLLVHNPIFTKLPAG